MAPLKLPFFLWAFSYKRKTTEIIKQQLQIKTTLEKNFILTFILFIGN